MNLSRREFLRVLAIAAAAGMPLARAAFAAGRDAKSLYDVPKFGNVGLLHFTDVHAQLQPVYFREPSQNIGVGAARGQPPHLVGEHLLKYYGIPAGTPEAYALSCVDFVAAARRYGKLGGFAHLATLVKRLRAERPGALLLDGGDTWQGSALSLWTRGQDMIDAQLALGVDIMTGHWEFTYGADRVREVVAGPFKDKIEFVAQNIRTADFGDPVFPDYALREVNGVSVAVIGQAFPYVPIAHPRRFVDGLTFGLQDERLQRTIDKLRKDGAAVVVLLSHNGMDVDLKLASKLQGLDAILGGHTHDGVPRPVAVKNAGGQTLVTNAGSNGKFLGVLDFDVRGGKVRDWRYRLLPVFANLLEPDAAMQELIDRHRAPHRARLEEKLAVSEGLLYRRGNFNGSFDQLLLDALREVQGAEIALSPGFRWGTTLLPGEAITRESLLDQTAITYPTATLNEYTGAELKAILEDVCDNLFNPDPYYQQGGDMVRVGGMAYACEPGAKSGHRISDMRIGGAPLQADRKYKVAGWAPVATDPAGAPVWEVVEQYLAAHRTLAAPRVEQPRLVGEAGNPGIVAT
ncbi:MAG TPA: thiosulfohydrolase SoxB [Rhodanobacteraceae bacterium]|nr:thiosulfohydrolase SoxB [Rhodanobacteraceae bacterium]